MAKRKYSEVEMIGALKQEAWAELTGQEALPARMRFSELADGAADDEFGGKDTLAKGHLGMM